MDTSEDKIPLERVDAYRWRIPQSYQPRLQVPGMVFADEELLEQIRQEHALQQVANVATLPGIVGYSLGMPDIHWGYGFPVGGGTATKSEGGVISPGGIGFDINWWLRASRYVCRAKACSLKRLPQPTRTLSRWSTWSIMQAWPNW